MLYELCEEVRSEFPSFKIVFKDESLMMKAINVFLMAVTLGRMRAFMTGFITTVGETVYVPSDWDSLGEVSRCVVIRHERVHMRQSRRYGRVLFSLAYLLLPLPAGLAYFRARLEMEAYAESVRALVEMTGTGVAFSQAYQQGLVDHFTTAQYLYMWPFPKTVKKWVTKAVDDAVAEYIAKR